MRGRLGVPFTNERLAPWSEEDADAVPGLRCPRDEALDGGLVPRPRLDDVVGLREGAVGAVVVAAREVTAKEDAERPVGHRSSNVAVRARVSFE